MVTGIAPVHNRLGVYIHCQVIHAQSASSVFGYTLSGGLDIDGNGYPDVTVGDLSGSHVTSYRTSPLANVTIDLFERKDVLEIVGDADRLCRTSENVNVQWCVCNTCVHSVMLTQQV